MDKIEYEAALKKVEMDYMGAKRAIYEQYALSNKRANVGDIVTDGRGNILVDKINVSVSFGLPYATYHGPLLTAKLLPYKNRERGFACDGDQLKIIRSN